MNAAPVQISRYPNRRFYDRQASKYISLGDIEQMVQEGRTVEIRDNQTGEDLTRAVLTRIIVDRQPEKMQLFPVDMLHFILRSNTVMAEFLQDYFRHSLTYLEYLQRHGNVATRLGTPMHWMKTWIDRIVPRHAGEAEPAGRAAEATNGNAAPDEDRAAQLARRVEELEERIRKMEAKEAVSKEG
jgi:polyhydroxyalkanoate synthesis repressor PhaR